MKSVEGMMKSAQDVKTNLTENTQQRVEELMFRRKELDAEIANHYLDGTMYGMAGSDGTWLSNYIRYTQNNHELISLFFADDRNPVDKKRRMMIFFCKVSLSLFLTTLITFAAEKNDGVESFFKFAGIGFLVSIIISPYGIILNELAKCSLCTRYNTCAVSAQVTGLFFLTLFSIGSIGFVVAGSILAVMELSGKRFSATFFLSIIFDSMSFFYFGIFNWILMSWKGFLVIPQFPIYLPCTEKKVYGFPPRFLPMSGCFPISFLLSMYNMGGNTYVEDKEAFQKKFPGRICIDVPPVKEKEDEQMPTQDQSSNVTGQQQEEIHSHEGVNIDINNSNDEEIDDQQMA